MELARALAMRPKLLMLDEPVAGMNREETEDMARFILDVRREWGITVLMVEHDMGMVMDLSDHVVVLNFGQVIARGRPAEVQRRSRGGHAPTSARATSAALRRAAARRSDATPSVAAPDGSAGCCSRSSLAGVGTGGLYALAGLAFVLIYKATRVVNIAIGEMMMIGAYLFFALRGRARAADLAGDPGGAAGGGLPRRAGRAHDDPADAGRVADLGRSW